MVTPKRYSTTPSPYHTITSPNYHADASPHSTTVTLIHRLIPASQHTRTNHIATPQHPCSPHTNAR
ncbi:hypothetical protein E2C01_092694 [Portunus trituberculatus]|uniref:Uncharacterized protein n=1 Tax=Portunus trituberculatus TaxID=210409 RepID=A0A5B7JH31_PORTR|nr:hypothetical protein [Portunus trituberculatus]